MDSFFEVREVFGRIFELLDKVVFSSEIFASFKLDILCVGLLSYSVPSLLIFIWKSSIQPILCKGSFVSILEIIVFKYVEMSPGKANVWVFRTSIKLAIEFDWKGQCPKSISYNTTPSDQISALFE